MDISESKARIWKQKFEGKNGPFYKYSVSVSKKMQDGNFINAYLPVVFTRKAEAPDDIPNGAVCSIKGFMSVDSYKDKEGKTKNVPQIVVQSIEFDDPTIGADSFSNAEDDIPF